MLGVVVGALAIAVAVFVIFENQRQARPLRMFEAQIGRLEEVYKREGPRDRVRALKCPALPPETTKGARRPPRHVRNDLSP